MHRVITVQLAPGTIATRNERDHIEKYVCAFTLCDGAVPQDLQAFPTGRADKVFFVWYADKSEQVDSAAPKQTVRATGHAERGASDLQLF